MTDEEKNMHHKMGVDYFNTTWTFIDRTDRTPDDDHQMILYAQASRFHWGFVGTPVEFQAGDWLISKVYFLLGHKEESMYAAKRCLEICEKENIGGFNIAFAHESMARACRLNGDMEGFREHQAIAMEKAMLVEDKDDREYTISEIEKNNNLV
jgi:hypothetical protein